MHNRGAFGNRKNFPKPTKLTPQFSIRILLHSNLSAPNLHFFPILSALPHHTQFPTQISHGGPTKKPRQALLQPLQLFPHTAPHIEPFDFPQIVVAVQNTLHHARPTSPPEIQFSPYALPRSAARLVRDAAAVRHRVHLVAEDRAGVHPLLPDLGGTGHPLPAPNVGVQDLRPVGGAGPRVSDAATEDVNLSTEDPRGGELPSDTHAWTRKPAVEAAVKEPDVGGGDIVDGAAEDVDGGAKDGVGGAHCGGGNWGERR